jgi:hypothetical protein
MNEPEEIVEESQGGIRKVPPAADAIVPRNMDEVRLLLTGRDSRFREPLTEREEREYLNVWKRKGKGFTKKQYASSETMKRKERQKKMNKFAKMRKAKREEQRERKQQKHQSQAE